MNIEYLRLETGDVQRSIQLGYFKAKFYGVDVEVRGSMGQTQWFQICDSIPYGECLILDIVERKEFKCPPRIKILRHI